MTVHELNRDQLDTLKWNYYYSEEYDPRITNAEGLPVLFPADIPDAVIFRLYAGIDFVPEDFGNPEEEKPHFNIPFMNDSEKMLDFLYLSKDEFLASYSYLTEDEYRATVDAVLKLLYPNEE